MPWTDKLFNCLGVVCFYSTSDLTNKYWQISLTTRPHLHQILHSALYTMFQDLMELIDFFALTLLMLSYILTLLSPGGCPRIAEMVKAYGQQVHWATAKPVHETPWLL